MSKMYFFSISKSQISSRLKIWVISLHRLPWTNSSWYGIGQQAMLWKIKQVKYGTTWLVKLRPRYNWKLRDFTLHTRHYLAHNFSFGFWYQMPKTLLNYFQCTRRTRMTRKTRTMTRTSGFSPPDAAVLFCEAQHQACVLCSCPPMYVLIAGRHKVRESGN